MYFPTPAIFASTGSYSNYAWTEVCIRDHEEGRKGNDFISIVLSWHFFFSCDRSALAAAML